MPATSDDRSLMTMAQNDDEITPEEIAECEAIMSRAREHPEEVSHGTAHPDGRITFFNADGTTETI